jgi:transposase
MPEGERMLRVDQVHVVRHKVLVEGRGIRAVAREMGISRNTVRHYLALSEPVRVEKSPRGQPVRERVVPRIEAILAESPRWTGGKQRLTATRLHQMLRAEGYDVGTTLVKEIVAEWKGRRREVFVPLVYRPGELAEVDFFEVLIDVCGERTKAQLFVMRLMHSGRDFAWLYERQDQVSFLDGHVRAFAHFGAVPQRVAYDNLKSAVRRMLVGSEREMTERFTALVSHYLFEPCFCRPATGHDKGGVEARGKAIRWQELVPIPAGESMLAINERLLARLDERQGEVRSDGDGRTIGERFAEERGSMLPLPERPFLARRTHVVTVSRRSLVTVEGAVYSVPCEWAGYMITVHVGATEVELVSPRREEAGRIVVVPRKRFGERSVDYRHYIRELARKPQAVRQVAPELVCDLGEPFGSTWRLLVDVHGPKDAARVFARILGFIETRGMTEVAHRLAQAIERGEAPLLALVPPPRPPSSLAQDDLPHGLGQLAVETGRAGDYDEWLRGGER